MIILYKQDGEVLYGIKEFLLDSLDDVAQLPTDIRSGSSARVLPTGEVFFLNGSKQWIPVKNPNIDEEGSTSDCSCESILNKLDTDKDGIVDTAEEADSIVMYEL